MKMFEILIKIQDRIKELKNLCEFSTPRGQREAASEINFLVELWHNIFDIRRAKGDWSYHEDLIEEPEPVNPPEGY